MATTTNYGWTTPDDTSLVKDGAAAIRTLGSSVDTTTKALNPSTTLGDIEYRSSTANTNTRLGIGTTGQVLSVSGGVPAWATPSSGGITLLSTTSLSGTSTTISSISQDYKNLYYELVGSTGAGNRRFFLNPNNVTGNYTGVANASTQNDTNVISSAANSTGTQYAFVSISDYTSSNKKAITNIGINSGTSAVFQAGYHDSTSAITSITITSSTGDVTISGTVKIYGVR